MAYKPLHEMFPPVHTGIRPEYLEGNSGHGRIIFAPGSPGRAEKIAEHFTGREQVAGNRGRGVVAYAGSVDTGSESYDALAVNTGMGCPSADIILSELIFASHDLIKDNKMGGLNVLRVGSCGWYGSEGDKRGTVAVVDSAITNDNTPYTYLAKKYPLRPHPRWLDAIENIGNGTDYRVETGATHTKNTLNIELLAHFNELGPEFRNRVLKHNIKEELKRMAKGNVNTSSMEEALLFGLFEGWALTSGLNEEIGENRINMKRFRLFGPYVLKDDPAGFCEGYWNKVRYRAGSVQAVFGDRDTPFYGDEKDMAKAEENAIDLSLRSGAEFTRLINRQDHI